MPNCPTPSVIKTLTGASLAMTLMLSGCKSSGTPETPAAQPAAPVAQPAPAEPAPVEPPAAAAPKPAETATAKAAAPKPAEDDEDDWE